MRILIGNDTDPYIIKKVDTRSWCQRIIWFAQNNDLVILSSAPDLDYIRFVTNLTGVNPNTLQFVILPPGQSGGFWFDHSQLEDKDFLSSVRSRTSQFSEIIPLWPSPSIAIFSNQINVPFHGSYFFSQNGAELSNSKSNFRALLAGQNITLPFGKVCFTQSEALSQLKKLFEMNSCAFIKKIHCSSGAGNLLVTTDESIKIRPNVGCSYCQKIDSDEDSVAHFCEGAWEWASDSGRFPVIVEEYLDVKRTIYCEFFCGPEGIGAGVIGELFYENGALIVESLSTETIEKKIQEQLSTVGAQIAKLYHTIGYRGPLSTDAVLTEQGNLYFTEVNARFSGSTHLYGPIKKFAGDRYIGQFTEVTSWGLKDTQDFIDRLKEHSLFYDAEKRKGIFPIAPPVKGYPIYGIISESEEETKKIRHSLMNNFLLSSNET